MMIHSNLEAAEQFLWQCARGWRQPAGLLAPAEVDWTRLVEIALDNKAQAVLAAVLSGSGQTEQLPAAASAALQNGVTRHQRQATHLGAALRNYLQFASQEEQEVVVLKGLWLSETVYGQPEMRPGADIDILLRRDDIAASLRILEEEMGYGRWWRPLLDDEYYSRHHLHQQRW